MNIVASSTDASSSIFWLLKKAIAKKAEHDAAMFGQAQYQSNVLRDLLIEQRRTNELLAQRLPGAPPPGR